MSQPNESRELQLALDARFMANQLGRAVFILVPAAGQAFEDTDNRLQDSYILPPDRSLTRIIWPHGWTYDPEKIRKELSENL